jgi:VWFA-related protein
MRHLLRVHQACAAGLAAVLALGLFGPRAAAQADLRERTLFVSVADRMNEPVTGLDVDDFVVREDGVRREVLRVSRATEPLDVAVLVDNAASSDDLIPRVRLGLQDFIEALTPTHSVALIGLAARPTILTDYTTSATSLRAGIGRLFTMSTSGMTLFDAIIEVSGGLRRREAPRAAIVAVLTDGIEYSNRRYRDVLNAIAESGAGFYPITVGQFPLTTNDIDRDRNQVLSMAPEASGGRRFPLLSSVAVEGALGRVARLLATQYKVVYSRPETLIPPQKVVVGTTREELTVHGTPARLAEGSRR